MCKEADNKTKMILNFSLFVAVVVNTYRYFFPSSKALTVDGFSPQEMALWGVKEPPFRIMLRYAAMKVSFYADRNVERVKRMGHGVEP